LYTNAAAGNRIGRGKVTRTPELVEIMGTTEYYIDGTVSVADSDVDVVHVIGYVNRTVGDVIVRYEVFRYHIGRRNHDRLVVEAVVGEDGVMPWH
jgi:hypothetical protein